LIATFQYFATGQDASNAFESGLAASGDYMAVSADASMNYSITKTFTSNNQFYMFAFNQTMLNVSFDDWGDSISSDTLKAHLPLTTPFNGEDPACVSTYRSFFGVFGSHIISGTTYGARLSLVVLPLSAPAASIHD
jgi:hypothetical protein